MEDQNYLLKDGTGRDAQKAMNIVEINSGQVSRVPEFIFGLN